MRASTTRGPPASSRPGSVPDADCLDYLEWLRWPGWLRAARRAACGGWRLGDGRFECAGCGRRTPVTAGTVFDRTRTPLTVWFTACWLFATQKDGVSALSLQRALDIGSYQTAWAMLHRLRSVLVRPGRDLLAGTVEVDETFIGGEEPGLRGGRARGREVPGRDRGGDQGAEGYRPLPDGRPSTTPRPVRSEPFVTGSVQPGARVITDGWAGYSCLGGLGYVHERRSQRAARALAAPRGPRRALACRAPGRLAGQALADGHPPGLGGSRSPARLPRRVRVPVQPAPVGEPGPGVLPAA